MEGPRFLLAIVLSIAVVIIVNLMFPPGSPPDRTPADSLGIDTAGIDSVVDAGRAQGPPAADSPLFDTLGEAESPAPEAAPAGQDTTPEPAALEADTVWVVNDVVRYGFSTLGAALVSAELLRFESYTREGPVQLVDSATARLLSYGIRVGDRTLPLSRFRFDAPTGDTLRVDSSRTVRFSATINGAVVELAYTFEPDAYVIEVDGQVQGAAGDATLLLDLGPRLAVNEADSAEDLRALAYVVNSRQDGIESGRIDDIETDRIEGGPLSWVALKNKYFLAAAIEPEPGRGAFGGLIAEGSPEGASSVQATLPLDRTGAFEFRLFFGPQEFGRLAAVGEGLQDVNPYGWRIFRPIIRPLAEIVTRILTALHNVLGFGYGWVLILFGFAMRGILWPLNAKAMRSQLKTMELQPRIKEIQGRYKDKPEQLQKEMMRLYKEEGFNPLGGCLPMLIPWPVLITLFFVFQNTIEFRGVEFLWLPDLSRPDPIYALPVLLGVSLFALQFMNMRATGSDNPQQKMLMYFMPVMMTVIFLNFASGLNLYYAASNIASLPQQVHIIGERKKAKARIEAKKKE
jgi:YidC/Oxa1 family membrane protein insertase